MPVGSHLSGVTGATAYDCSMEVRVTYDGLADAAYVYLVAIGPGEVATTVAGEGDAASVNLDFDRDGRLLGIEVLGASRWLPGDVIEQAERIG